MDSTTLKEIGIHWPPTEEPDSTVTTNPSFSFRDELTREEDTTREDELSEGELSEGEIVDPQLDSKKTKEEPEKKDDPSMEIEKQEKVLTKDNLGEPKQELNLLDDLRNYGISVSSSL